MLKESKHIGFDDRWLILFGAPIISLIVNLMIFGEEAIGPHSPICFIISITFVSSYWISIRYFFMVYHKRFDHYRFTPNRLIFVIFWMLIIFFGVHLILNYFFLNIVQVSESIFMTDPLRENLTSGILIAGTFFLYEGIYYFNKSRLTEIEKNKLERISAEQTLNTLKNQVNPHFLFNSLNTLVAIIPEEPELAIEFVQELSKSYRKILEVRDEKLITLKLELESLDSYVYLLKTRFQGKIKIDNTLDENLMNQFILPLSLQILIENAVKHNITSTSKPLRIKIYNEANFVIVENNLQKKDQNYGSTKLGLANIRSRYQLLVNENIVVEETPQFFRVKLPLIKNLIHENTDH